MHWVDGLSQLANGDFPEAGLVGTSVENIEVIGWHIGASYTPMPGTTVTAVYGRSDAKDPVPATALPQANTQWTFHADILHRFWKNMQVGIEYQRAERERFDGQAGRLQPDPGRLVVLLPMGFAERA
ncbi:MAG TPA: hypothetical protein VNM66_08055 [Thermodesulfobacteriota bacterium]|nr:hypothetical protein [Thermodesulfobacteriota bacterium]